MTKIYQMFTLFETLYQTLKRLPLATCLLIKDKVYVTHEYLYSVIQMFAERMNEQTLYRCDKPFLQVTS